MKTNFQKLNDISQKLLSSTQQVCRNVKSHTRHFNCFSIRSATLITFSLFPDKVENPTCNPDSETGPSRSRFNDRNTFCWKKYRISQEAGYLKWLFQSCGFATDEVLVYTTATICNDVLVNDNRIPPYF